MLYFEYAGFIDVLSVASVWFVFGYTVFITILYFIYINISLYIFIVLKYIKTSQQLLILCLPEVKFTVMFVYCMLLPQKPSIYSIYTVHNIQ